MGVLFDFLIIALFHDLNRFSLHGAWPQRWDGSWPSFCGGPPFNGTLLKNLEPRLHHDWPATWTHGDYKFHEHEYLKHGTCTGLTEHEYFRRALDTFDAYDINGFSISEYSPSASKIKREFQEKYEHDLIVSHEKHGRVVEVRYCVNKQWVLIDCPNIAFLPPSL